MARSINYLEEYSEIEFRSLQVTSLLRARCYVLSVRNDMLSSETLELIKDNHEALMKFKTHTQSLEDLSQRKKLNKKKSKERNSLALQWSNLKTEINNNISILETHSNLLQSAKAPSNVNVLAILRDLQFATFIFESNGRPSGTKPRK